MLRKLLGLRYYKMVSNRVRPGHGTESLPALLPSSDSLAAGRHVMRDQECLRSRWNEDVQIYVSAGCFHVDEHFVLLLTSSTYQEMGCGCGIGDGMSGVQDD
jgi:hypothetical protein